MSSITTDFQAPISPARATIDRVADGVIAGYIHSLAHGSERTAARKAGTQPELAPPCAKHALRPRTIRRRHAQLLALSRA